MKPCSLLQGQWMACSVEIPNVEEQGEVKDFEGKRTAPCKAAAGHPQYQNWCMCTLLAEAKLAIFLV